MDGFLEFLSRGFERLLARAGGPLNFRLVVMPTVVTLLALRADWKDAREGRPAFLGAFLTDPAERRRLFRSAMKDVGRIFIVAIVLDTIYELIVFRWFYPVQVVIVAVVCAVVPYVLVRGPITRLARLLHRKWFSPAHAQASKTNPDAERREKR